MGTPKIVPKTKEGFTKQQTTKECLSMNEKTAKLINKFALAKGVNPKTLKKEWNALTAKERFLRRQEMLKALKS